MKRQNAVIYLLLPCCLLLIGLVLVLQNNGGKSQTGATADDVSAGPQPAGAGLSQGEQENRPDPGAKADKAGTQPDWIEQEVQQKFRMAVKDLNTRGLRRESYEQRWYRETGAATKERLTKLGEPQSIHGRVAFVALYEEINPSEPMIVYAKGEGNAPPVSSLILDGAYSLGKIDPGTIQLHLKQTTRTPAIWVHDVKIKDGQSALEHVWELGDVTVVVKVYDADDAPLNSEEVELLIGGISDKIHTWKTAKSIQNGEWQVNYLLPDTYVVKATWKGLVASQLVPLKSGQSTIELRLRNAKKIDG